MARPRPDRADEPALDRGLRLGPIALALALAACGGPPPATVEPPAEAEPERVELSPPGGRLTVTTPPAERIPHTLRYRVGELLLTFADATVEPGTEDEVVGAYVTTLQERADGAVTHEPFALDGAQGVDLEVPGDPAVRAVAVWAEGAVSRVSIRYPAARAIEAARIVDSIRFDPSRPLDPRAALGVDATPVEGLPLLRVSTEQLIFREGGRAAPFVGPDAAVDVAYVPLEVPPDERERGRLLGLRFRGLPLADPRLAELEGEGLPGFAMHGVAEVEGVELALLGAYLELDGGALLVRASVAREREAEWAPRLWALIRSLRVP